MYRSSQFDETDPWATGSAALTEAGLTGISGMLFVCFFCLMSGSLVYGAFIAAMAAMVPVLAWVCLSYS